MLKSDLSLVVLHRFKAALQAAEMHGIVFLLEISSTTISVMMGFPRRFLDLTGMHNLIFPKLGCVEESPNVKDLLLGVNNEGQWGPI